MKASQTKAIQLETVAHTSSPRNPAGNDYPVVLFYQRYEYASGWVIRVEGTGGSWFLSTLIEDGWPRGGKLSIDYGQDWWWENPAPAIREALMLLVKLDPEEA